MPDFFYPLLFLTPGFDGEAAQCDSFLLARRKWETSTFDLATLATRHKLHLPYQAMDVFLSRCNMELRMSAKRSLADASKAFGSLRMALYATGVSPFLCPFVTTRSINDYSGINSRDSDVLRPKLHPGMEIGLTSDAEMLEAWPVELSFQCRVIPERLAVTEEQFTLAAQKSAQWDALLIRFPQLTAVADATRQLQCLEAQGNRCCTFGAGWKGSSLPSVLKFHSAARFISPNSLATGLTGFPAMNPPARHTVSGPRSLTVRRPASEGKSGTRHGAF